MRLVFDTATIVAAMRSDTGASRRLLTAVIEGRSPTMLISVPLFLEYEAVMTRSEHLDASGLSVVDVEALLDGLADAAEHVDLAFRWRPTLRDADDDMVLETAVNGRADGIVTFNRRDFGEAAQQFGIAVMSPGEAVTNLELDK